MKKDKYSYVPYKEIKFSKIRNEFRKIILFENVYLNMQGMNIYITDPILTGWEYQLLDQFIETERTPTESALTLSAFSQMWIFQLYELLRTLRQKTNRITRKSQEKVLIPEGKYLAEIIENKLINKCRRDSILYNRINNQWEALKKVFESVEAMRMNLAKHEIPKKESSYSPAPGYGRINMICGSLDYQLVDKNGNMYFQSRRDIADMLRGVRINA